MLHCLLFLTFLISGTFSRARKPSLQALLDIIHEYEDSSSEEIEVGEEDLSNLWNNLWVEDTESDSVEEIAVGHVDGSEDKSVATAARAVVRGFGLHDDSTQTIMAGYKRFWEKHQELDLDSEVPVGYKPLWDASTSTKGYAGEKKDRKAREAYYKRLEKDDRKEYEANAERAASAERGERGERTERSERDERGERGSSYDRQERAERGARGESAERSERGERAEKGMRGERGARGESMDLGERMERLERQERASRGEVGQTIEQTDRNLRGLRQQKREYDEMSTSHMRNVEGWKMAFPQDANLSPAQYIGKTADAKSDLGEEAGVAGSDYENDDELPPTESRHQVRHRRRRRRRRERGRTYRHDDDRDYYREENPRDYRDYEEAEPM